MYYVYLLESERDGRCYVGCTCNIIDRMRFHNECRTGKAEAAGHWKLVAYKAFQKHCHAIQEVSRLKRVQNSDAIKEEFKYTIHNGTVGTVLGVSCLPVFR